MRRDCSGLAAWVLAAALASCSNPSKRQVGGETHWLRACAMDDDCGGESLSCVCGTCTRACGGSDECAVSGAPPAACFDTRSPLLQQRCEGSEPEPASGVCLLDCASGATCGTGRTCHEGACIPASEPADAGSSSAQSGEPTSLRPSDFADVPASVEWSTPIQSPALQPTIAGGDARITGTWIEVDCDPTSPPEPQPWGCMRLEVTQSATGEVTGTVHVHGIYDVFGPPPLVQDPEVGYPTPDPSTYEALTNLQTGVPYRILDGRLEQDRFTFVWSPYDLWHDWCVLQEPYPWTIGEHAFSFCVPQDREQWTTIDEGKIVLCRSADFEPLCTSFEGGLIPCPCVPSTDNPRCNPNFCQCDGSGCDANVRLVEVHTELALDGDVMTGNWWDAWGSWSGNLRRVSP